MQIEDIEGVLFDYGGTLDSNGQHWGEIIWQLYQKAGLKIEREVFNAAYVYAERKMATSRLILPTFNFQEVLQTKVEAQFEYLQQQGISLSRELITAIAWDGYFLASEHVKKAKEVLDMLRGQIPMVMVSNFYGNLSAVLEDFGLLDYFDSIVESAVVGVRKPDPAIYNLGVAALGLPPDRCLVIGDSFAKDIIPAKACGCQTVWFKGAAWSGDEEAETGPVEADHVIYDIAELVLMFDKLLVK